MPQQRSSWAAARRVQAPELVAPADDALIAIEDIDDSYRVGVAPKGRRSKRDGTDG